MRKKRKLEECVEMDAKGKGTWKFLVIFEIKASLFEK